MFDQRFVRAARCAIGALIWLWRRLGETTTEHTAIV
jgi:hypothetical protein